jgi:hypothetical protein
MMKTMIITFFRIKGTVHFEFISRGQTDKQVYYMETSKRLREAVLRKIPELWSSDWILQYDNAPVHKALSIKQFLPQKSITEMEHPAYSPYLTTNDLWQKVKVKLSLCFLTEHHAMKAYWGWRYNYTHSLSSALDGGEWSASRPGRFTPRERAPGTHWIRG